MSGTLSGAGDTVGNKIVKDPYRLKIILDSYQHWEDNTTV